MTSLSILTGKEFYWSIIAGGKKVIEHQEEINKINVFPVPDGDTGANLAATFTSVIYNAKEKGSLQDIAMSIGDAALDGARGNSGVIFAQFLYGIGQEVKDITSLTTERFAEIIQKASNYVYQAIPNPQEGTIVTVIRKWAEFINDKKTEFLDFDLLLEKAEEVAKHALHQTTEQLESLKLAKVVDAGAKGFVLFLQGMKETILTRSFSRDEHNMDHLLMWDADTALSADTTEELSEDALHNRYCTETCLLGENIDRHTVQNILEKHSDSIVMAGSDKKLRLHFHTNYPAEVFGELKKLASFGFQKIEDMHRQYDAVHKRKHPIAFVVDSGISLSQEFMDEHQIHIVPISLILDGTSYYDLRSMNLNMMTHYLTQNKNISSSTSQPSPKAFADMFNYLSKYYESVVVLTLSSRLSGTYNSALQAVTMVRKDIKISVVDALNLSAGGSVIACSISEDIASGLSHDQIVERACKAVKRTDSFVNFKTIDHLVRSGRMSFMKAWLIKLLKLCPILQVKEGVPVITGKAIGFQKAFNKTLNSIKVAVQSKKTKYYTISHTITNPAKAQKYIAQIQNIFGYPALDIAQASPSIANGVGLEAINVGILFED
ncbi:MAG: DegV family protein [Brevinemataceae bacterium]